MLEAPKYGLLDKLQSILMLLTPKDAASLRVLEELTTENLAHIEEIRKMNSWSGESVIVDNQRYYLLGTIQDQNSIEKYLRGVSSAVLSSMTKNFGFCVESAMDLQKSDSEGSSLVSNASWYREEKPTNFGIGSHTVFLKNLGKQWLVLDLTTRFYIDRTGKKMDVLVLVASSHEEAKGMLSDVYGDNWYDGRITR